jgi:hypothetical protein
VRAPLRPARSECGDWAPGGVPVLSVPVRRERQGEAGRERKREKEREGEREGETGRERKREKEREREREQGERERLQRRT